MRITTLMTARLTIADLTQAMNRLDQTQEELSSGKRINQPSDDPYGTSLAIQLNDNLAALNSYQRNVNDGTAWTTEAGGALQNMANMLQRVRELTVEAGNGTQSQADLNNIADEIDQLTDAIKQEANTQYAGQYIFAGTNTTTAPYQTSTGDAYQGNSGTISRQIGPGATVAVSNDISTLLGNGQSASDGKLLGTLRNIAQDMRSGNISGLMSTDVPALDTNFDTLTKLQANVGTTQDRLQLAGARIQDLQVATTQSLSNTEDADMAQTAIDYSTEQAAFNAALRASANIVQSSLLDFLR